MSAHLTYLQAVVTGLVQGVTELFPVSSLGHNVLIPALIGGSWARDLNVSAKNSPYLAFIVGLHVATAVAMILFFWRDWVRIVRGFFTSLRKRKATTADERLAWMIILGTIPVGIVGAALQKVFVNVFAKPELAALFLAINGVILLFSERMRRTREAAAAPVAVPVAAAPAGRPAGGPVSRAGGPGSPGAEQPPWDYPQLQPPPGYPRQPPEGFSQQPHQQQWQGPGAHRAPAAGGAARQGAPGGQADHAVAADRRLSTIGYGRAVLVGAAQILALFPGISRDGIVTVAGMWRGLRREDAVRYSFLLSAPVILAAGVLKVKDLTGPISDGIRGPILVGSLIAFAGAYVSIRFLTKYFSEDNSLSPFGIYCLVAGLGALAYLGLK